MGIGLNNTGYLNLKEGSEVTFNISYKQPIEVILKITSSIDIPEYKKQAGYKYCSS